MSKVSKEVIKEAHNRIKPFINRTPILKSDSINQIVGAELFFKCENFQKVGAFKYRGATNALLQLAQAEKPKAVATHSSGNHAQALALAAREQGVKAYIVMPNNSPKVKVNAVKGYGAEVTFCEPNLEARESTLDKIVAETGAVFIHPYDRNDIIAGQGTACLELVEEVSELDTIVSPVGGGGLLSGTAIYAKSKRIEVYGAEPKGADDAKKSLNEGQIIPSVNPNTICDGLLTSLGKLNFEYISDNVDDIWLANDEEILSAMRLIYERMKIVVEPSSAVTLAAIINNKKMLKGKKIGVILSGGNVDLDSFFDGYEPKS
ncbi:MAG: pyridoxal-phosphate dependent enzyme [Chlorobiota bacterium]